MPDKPSHQAPAVDPLELSRRRLAYLDEGLKRDDLPPELRWRVPLSSDNPSTYIVI